MSTLRYVVKMSEGGKGKGRQWTNSFHINSAGAISDAGVKTDSDALVAALRHAVLDVVSIDSVIIKDPSNDGHGYDPAKVRIIPYGVSGSKLTAGSATDIKQIVVLFSGACATGRNAHNSLRMLLMDGDVDGGTTGDPTAHAEPAGVADVVVALNAMIAGGTDFRKYGKRKAGAITDDSITAWSYNGVGYRTTRAKRHKRGSSTTPSGWLEGAKNILDDVLRMSGSYQLAKAGSAALRALPVAAAVDAIEAGASAALEVLPELALL